MFGEKNLSKKINFQLESILKNRKIKINKKYLFLKNKFKKLNSDFF